MTYQHYLPATFLANFAEVTATPRRDSLIVVGDRRTGEVRISSVGRVAGISGFYEMDIGPSRDFIDTLWTSYEGSLAQAIDALIHGGISAMDWAIVLVQFVADMLVRPPAFNARFATRWPEELLKGELGEHITSPGNTNAARVLERQRLFAPFGAARWDVLSAVGEASVILNDLGSCRMRTLTKGEYGIAIPWDSRHLLGLIPQRRRRVAVEKNSHWVPIINYLTLPIGDHRRYNETTGQSAQRSIFGTDEETVRRYLYLSPAGERTAEPSELGFMDARGGRPDEMKWFWLIEELGQPPKARGAWINLGLYPY